MRVLMVNNYHYRRGGSEAVMFEEQRLLTERGHATAAFSARHPANLPSVLEAQFPDVDESGHGRGVVARARSYARMVENGAVRSAFRRALDTWRPDVVHFHNVYGRLTPVVFDVARERKVPFVLTAHDYKLVCASYLRLDEGRPCTACRFGHYLPALSRRCHKGSRISTALYAMEATWNGSRYAAARVIACPSEFMRDNLAAGGVPADRLRVLPNCVAVVEPRHRARERLVAYVGRLSREKGVACLVRAAAGLDVEVAIAGDGPERSRLEALAAEIGVAGRVRFLGQLGTEHVRDLLARAALAVLPSEWFENAPMALLDAYAAGTPVVGAAIGGIPEMIVPGATGELFPPGDAGALRNVLERLLARPGDLQAMGERALALSRDRYGPEAHVRKLESLYAEVLA